MRILDGLARRIWVLGVPLGVVAAAVVIAAARPWQDSPARAGEVEVRSAILRPGQVILVLVNGSEEAARVAQVIVNDAFVDFRQSRRVLQAGDAERITVPYPWIRGESYEVQLITATGATVDYEIEEAESGSRSATA